MKKLAIGLAFVLPIALLVWACGLLFLAPPEPPLDWRLHMPVAAHDARLALLGHIFRVAAYVITWAIQLGYVAWLGLKWQAQARNVSKRS